MLNDFCGLNTFDEFSRKQSISSNFVIAMLRNSDTTIRNQCPNDPGLLLPRSLGG